MVPGKKALTTSLSLPGSLEPGRYQLSVALVDPAARLPTVKLAITGRAEDGWYPLSPVDVVRRP